MGPEGIKQTIQLGNETITIETGRLAKQADGSAVVTCGKTVLLATVVTAKDAKDDVDFLPLSVDYKEKYAATGKFPGGFFKREGKPSDYEILISRLVDRALRPLFPDDYHAETQVQITLLSGEAGVLPDAYAALAASAAIAVSDIPFHGPISEVRVAYINGEYVINPKEEALKDADLELMVAASMKDICMVEGESKEVSEEVMLNALKAAHEAIKVHCQAQIDLASKVEKAQTKREYCHEVNDEELRADMMEKLYKPCYDFALTGNANKHEREDNFNAILDSYLANLSEEELEESTFKSVKKRIPWLCALLILGLIISLVMRMFESAIVAVPAIVFFQSMILGMGGNVGTQSLAVTIRAISDEDISRKEIIKLVLKEIRIAFFNGLLIGLISFVVVTLYLSITKTIIDPSIGFNIFDIFKTSGVVSASLLISMVISGLIGTLIPILLQKCHIDPAVASGPFITSINDIMAIVVYYGITLIVFAYLI